MSDYVQDFWKMKLQDVKEALEANNFGAHIVDDAAAAKELILSEILPAVNPASLSWGGSATFMETGLYEALNPESAPEGIKVLDPSDKSLTPEQAIELRRQALLVDLYFTGTNALTEDGTLVNLDMIGNRVGALTFGPKHVVVITGRNKLVTDLQEAFNRIKGYAAPTNAMRLSKKTPCVKTAYCHDCKSPDRICNTWTITEKSFPKARITVVLVNQDMGL